MVGIACIEQLEGGDMVERRCPDLEQAVCLVHAVLLGPVDGLQKLGQRRRELHERVTHLPQLDGEGGEGERVSTRMNGRVGTERRRHRDRRGRGRRRHTSFFWSVLSFSSESAAIVESYI